MMNSNPSLYPHNPIITQSDRTVIKNHQPAVLWLTGLSGSGKSTVANQVEAVLCRQYQAHTYLLDGDNIRGGLNRDLGFAQRDREENIRRIGEVCCLFVDAGLIAITAFISPYRSDRDLVRARLPENTFFEIYVDCPLEVCEQRDPKGLYARARQGLVPEFTGITSPYEPPLNPEITLFTAQWDPQRCARHVIEVLLKQNILPQV